MGIQAILDPLYGVDHRTTALILVTHGFMLFITLAAVGMALISSFTVTIVMAQELLPNNLGIASGLMAGFAIAPAESESPSWE